MIYLFIQFTNLREKYYQSYNYNTVDDLYALDDIVKYIKSDEQITQYIKQTLKTEDYIFLTDCDNFSNIDYCSELFNLENIEQILVLNNKQNYKDITGLDDDISDFIFKISNDGYEKYRLVALFKDSTLATIRFGV